MAQGREIGSKGGRPLEGGEKGGGDSLSEYGRTLEGFVRGNESDEVGCVVIRGELTLEKRAKERVPFNPTMRGLRGDSELPRETHERKLREESEAVERSHHLFPQDPKWALNPL